MKYHKLSTLSNRDLLFYSLEDLLFYSLEGLKSEFKVWAYLLPFEGCDGRVCSKFICWAGG